MQKESGFGERRMIRAHIRAYANLMSSTIQINLHVILQQLHRYAKRKKDLANLAIRTSNACLEDVQQATRAPKAHYQSPNLIPG
jgi:hypothetical protein